MNSDTEKREAPQFRTESPDDLFELLERAAKWAETDVHAPTIAAELREGAEFVEREVR